MKITRNSFLYRLDEGLYSRTEVDFKRGTFRVRGDTVDINLPYADTGLRVIFFGDEIEEIQTLELHTGKKINSIDFGAIFPANLYVAPKEKLKMIIKDIEDELTEHERFFESEGRYLEAKRIRERVNFDLGWIKKLGNAYGKKIY